MLYESVHAVSELEEGVVHIVAHFPSPWRWAMADSAPQPTPKSRAVGLSRRAIFGVMLPSRRRRR